jgi:UDP-N-acetylmuramoyl-tripeptide--D-alanyl-D-alanine ligase
MLAVVAVAEQCGMDASAIARGLGRVRPVHSRLETRRGPNSSVVIDDSYNANRVSMLAGLQVLDELGGPGHRVAVLGDMYELGGFAEAEHRAVGQAAAASTDRLIAIGSQARWLAEAALRAGMPADRIEHVDAPGDIPFRSDAEPPPDVARSRQQLAERLRDQLGPGDVILIKAARGMRLDYLVDLLSAPGGDEQAGKAPR